MNPSNTPMYFEAVSVDAELPDNGMICVVLAGGRIPMMSQMRAPNEWWTLGMANATKYEKGITHWLRPVEIVCDISDEEILKFCEQERFAGAETECEELAFWMRSKLAPTIAVLKNANSSLKELVNEMKKEIDKCSQQLAAEKERSREMAIGFAEWLKDNCSESPLIEAYLDGHGCDASYLFDLYLTSLTKQSDGK